MKSILQLRILYGLPILLAIIACTLSALNGRTLYLVLALLLLIAAITTLQLFTAKIRRTVKQAQDQAGETAILAGALFSTLWTTFGAALLITIKRH